MRNHIPRIALVAALIFAPVLLGAGSSTGTENASDWVTANRDSASTHYSPLKQITASNAASLRPVCSYNLGEQVQFQDAPIVANGVMYVATFENTYALNASNCRLIWRTRHKIPSVPPFGSIRGLGYGGNQIYVATLDGHVMALNAANGKIDWDKQILPKGGLQYFVSAPLAVGNVVFVGNAGSDVGAIGDMFALDQRTGRVLWKTSLVATGNSPAAKTWPRKPGLHIAGGGTWTSYTFDPAKDLLYVPAGNPGPDFNGDYRPGDNLYTNSIVALNGTTGAITAYRQLVAHDVHDWDVSTPPALITTRGGTAALAVVGKDAFLYELDPQLTQVLHRTATTTMYNGSAPITPQGTRFCPGTQGGTEFNPVAYSPQTNMLYTASVDWCSMIKLEPNTKFVPGKPFVGSTNGFGTLDPQSRAKGWLTAVDADTGRVKWKWQSGMPLLAAVVPTAGGVVFTGGLNGDFMAFNARTGKMLYRHKTPAPIPGGLAAYGVNGKEYIAVVSGYPGPIWKTPKATDRIVIFGL